MSDIEEIRRKVCGQDKRSLQISCDGMSESKSTNISIDVFSSKFPHCKAIFPHRLVRPLKKFPVDNLFQFSRFLEDIVENNLDIDQYIADNLKRATGKNSLNHSANFPCEYCFCKGIRFQPKTNKTSEQNLEKLREKIMTLSDLDVDITELENEIVKAKKSLVKKKSQIVWPSCTMHAEPRTQRKVEEIANRIENGEQLTPDESKGVVGRSPLMTLERFDFVLDSPTEYLHSVCLGVSKRLIILTFSVGENRYRVTKRKLSDPCDFNILIQNIKSLREFSRRLRELDFSVFKGQEFRNIILFFFPVVLQCIQEKAQERKLWLLFVYMIRSCILPEKEFKNIDLEKIESACEQFYKLYEKLFGEVNCSYNTHIVCSHLLEMRHHGPLTFTSAFSFESFYGEIRNSFVPGTPSTLKQIFKKILLKRALSQHTCENSIYYSDHETPMENNTLIYCFKDLTHKFYKITEVHKDFLICKPQGKKKYTFPELSTYNFAQIGIYKAGLLSDQKVKIYKKNVHGKVLLVNDFLITCPNNILREK